MEETLGGLIELEVEGYSHYDHAAGQLAEAGHEGVVRSEVVVQSQHITCVTQS